jgi:hypothetical protein
VTNYGAFGISGSSQDREGVLKERHVSLLVTLTGNAGKYLLRGAIWEIAASSYRAYVHLVPSELRPDLYGSAFKVVTVTGPTLQKALDAAVARVMTAAGAPVKNLQVWHAPRDSEGRGAGCDRTKPVPVLPRRFARRV